MSSGFDPRHARWDHVEPPRCRGLRPSVVRTSAPADLLALAETGTDALLDDVTAGLTRSFAQVLPVEAAADPPGVPRGAVRLLHAAVDPDGEGVAVETLLLRSGEVTCWVAPAGRYAAELATARRAMAGRPPLRRDDEPVTADGAPVTEARLTVTGPGEGDWIVMRHGPAAHARPTASEAGVELPASVLPMWACSVTGTGPRPIPGERPMLITSRPALDRLLGHAEPDEAAVRTALEAPDLPDAEAAELSALARGLVRRWCLEWIAGRDDAPEDEDVPPRLEGRGRLEILDAGPLGMWRVLTDLPEELTGELGEPAVGLKRTAPADVWRELTLPIAG